MTVHMTREQKQMARRLRAQGMTLRAVGQQLGYSYEAIRRTVTRVQRRQGMPDDWTPSAGRLRAAEREAILLGIARGETLTAIACSLGRSTSTVTREVAANGGRQHYRAWDAHRRARECARRPKPFKLQDGPLCALVTEWLELLWSPEEISKRLRHEFPHDPMMHVSHETIGAADETVDI